MTRSASPGRPARLFAGLALAALVPLLAGCALPWTAPDSKAEYPQLIPMDEILAQADVAARAPAP
ncbi:hypothetical protein [Tabrizicola aquatica]|uniref:hypothetical protein n=1 Tax=Tabrizicola aquatica TaxID=909926 RepID=UPI000CD01AA0|nr:hypothetical protein [Tabrizicola aquatica]